MAFNGSGGVYIGSGVNFSGDTFCYYYNPDNLYINPSASEHNMTYGGYAYANINWYNYNTSGIDYTYTVQIGNISIADNLAQHLRVYGYAPTNYTFSAPYQYEKNSKSPIWVVANNTNPIIATGYVNFDISAYHESGIDFVVSESFNISTYIYISSYYNDGNTNTSSSVTINVGETKNLGNLSSYYECGSVKQAGNSCVQEYSGGKIAGLSAGTTTVVYNKRIKNGYIYVDNDGNPIDWFSGTHTFTVTVNSKSSSITQSNITKTYGDAAFTITPGRTGVSSLSWSLSKTGVVSLSATTGNSVTATIQGAGTVTVTLSGTASSGYSAPANKTFTITVNKASWPTVTISPSSKSVTYGAANFTISVSGYPSGSSISWSTSNSNSASIYSGSTSATVTIDPKNVGSATITCTLTNSNYSGTVTKTCTVTVNKASSSLSVTNNGKQVYGYLGTIGTLNISASPTAVITSPYFITLSTSYSANYTTPNDYSLTYNNIPMTNGTNDYSTLSIGSPQTPGKYGVKISGTANYTNSSGTYANPNYNNPSSVDAYIEFIKATPTITCSTTAMTFTYGGAAQTRTATKSHTQCNAITVSSSNTNVATVSISGSTVTVTPKNAGSCTIKLNIASSPWFNAASQVSFNVTVNKASWPTVTISPSSKSVTYGAANFTISVSGYPSGSSISWSTSNSNSAAIYSGSTSATVTIDPSNVGSATITCTLTNSNYSGTVTKTCTVTVNKASSSISVSPATQNIYGYLGINATATATTTPSSLTVSYTGVTGGTVSVSDKTITFNRPSAPGKVSANFYAVGNSNYNNSSYYNAYASFIKATPTITCSTTQVTFTYGDYPPSQTFSVTNSHPYTNGITATLPGGVSANTVAGIELSNNDVSVNCYNAGTTWAYFNIASSTWFNAATQKAVKIVVNKRQIVTNQGSDESIYYGTTINHTISRTPSVGSVGYLESSNTDVATVTATSATNLSIVAGYLGTTTIKVAHYAPNENYIDAVIKEFTVTVVQAPWPTVTINPTSKTVTYGADNFTISVSGYPANTGFSWSSNNTNVASIDSGSTSATVTIDPKNAGSATITCTLTNSNYQGNSITKTCAVTVNKATWPTVTISLTSKSVTYGAANFDISVSGYPSGSLISWSTSNINSASIYSGSTSATVTIDPKNVGSATITCTLTNSNYSGTVTKTCTVTVNKKSTSVATNISNQTFTYYDTSSFSLTPNKSEGISTITHSFTSNTSNITGENTISYQGQSSGTFTFNILNSGTAQITFSGTASDGNYSGSSKTITITVNKKQISVNAGDNVTKIYGDAAFNQSVSHSPNVTTLSSVSSSNTDCATVAKVNNTTVKITPVNANWGAATATITVTFNAPNNNYISGSDTMIVTVNRKNGSLTLTSPNVNHYGYLGDYVNSYTTVPASNGVTSNNTNVTISNGKYTVKRPSAPGTVTATLTSVATKNYNAATATLSIKFITAPVTLTASPASITTTYIANGKNHTVTISSSPSSAPNVTSTSSNNESVATSSNNNNTVTITTKNAGSTNITVSTNADIWYNAASKDIPVTVNQFQAGITNPGNKTFTYSDALTVDITSGKTAGVGTLTWTIATTNGCVSLKSSSNNTATFNIDSVGTTTVTISAPSTDTANYIKPNDQSFNITINKGNTVTTLNPTSNILWIAPETGKSYLTSFNATATMTSTPTDRSIGTDDNNHFWESSNTNIATVSSPTGSGVTITPKNPGTCTIYSYYLGSTVFNASDKKSIAITVYKRNPYTLSLTWNNNSVNNKWINTDNNNDIVIYATPSILLDTIGKKLSGESSATNIVSNVTETNTDSNTKANYTCEITGTLGTSKITIETEDAWNGNNFYPKISATTNISRITFKEPSSSISIKITNNNYLNTHYGVKTNNDLTLCPTASSIENLSLIKIMNRTKISDNQLVPESYIFKQITSTDYYKSTDYYPPYN